MKKIICLALVLIMTLSFVACEKEDIYTKSEGVMTWEEYNAAAIDDEVVIEAYIQAKQAWWDNKGTFYLQDGVGGYFAYELRCTEEEYNQLAIGTKVRLSGYKASYKGEYEIIDATFEILEGNYVAPATDVTSKLGTAAILNYQNMKVAFKGLTVVEVNSQEGEGKDIYIKFNYDGKEYEFCIESYLTNKDTDVYKTASNLKAGDVVDVEGFAYWYDGAYSPEANVVNPNAINTHITGITVK